MPLGILDVAFPPVAVDGVTPTDACAAVFPPREDCGRNPESTTAASAAPVPPALLSPPVPKIIPSALLLLHDSGVGCTTIGRTSAGGKLVIGLPPESGAGTRADAASAATGRGAKGFRIAAAELGPGPSGPVNPAFTPDTDDWEAAAENPPLDVTSPFDSVWLCPTAGR